MKKEKSKKYTIRIDEEFHDILKDLKFEYGTMENGLRKVYEYWKERKNANKQIIKNRNSSEKN